MVGRMVSSGHNFCCSKVFPFITAKLIKSRVFGGRLVIILAHTQMGSLGRCQNSLLEAACLF